MDKYIKISDLLELIENQQKKINNDYENGKMKSMSNIISIGTLEDLKRELIKNIGGIKK